MLATFFFSVCLFLQNINDRRKTVMEELVPMVVVAIIFGSLVTVIKILSDNRIRKNLIESGQVDEKAKYLYLKGEKSVSDPLATVKWGMVMIGIGIALLIGQFIDQFVMYGDSEGITIGLMFLFAGIAFLIYYTMKKNQEKTNQTASEE